MTLHLSFNYTKETPPWIFAGLVENVGHQNYGEIRLEFQEDILHFQVHNEISDDDPVGVRISHSVLLHKTWLIDLSNDRHPNIDCEIRPVVLS